MLGVGLMIGPWLFRLSSDLTEERAERIRSQERADVAAHLHDSVLQTLALIQKTADDPAQVAQLARAQERDLRSWLYAADGADGDHVRRSAAPGGGRGRGPFGVPVEVVCVGDRAVTEPLRPLVRRRPRGHGQRRQALRRRPGRRLRRGRPASGVEVFVRDRGAGFDPDEVADDRHGVRDSIVDRMTGHGGTARCAAPRDEGTEVRLHLPDQ